MINNSYIETMIYLLNSNNIQFSTLFLLEKKIVEQKFKLYSIKLKKKIFHFKDWYDDFDIILYWVR